VLIGMQRLDTLFNLQVINVKAIKAFY
jgi:hypothetical protein